MKNADIFTKALADITKVVRIGAIGFVKNGKPSSKTQKNNETFPQFP